MDDRRMMWGCGGDGRSGVRGWLSVQIDRLQQHPGAHQPVGINGPGHDLAVPGSVVAFHLFDDTVMEGFQMPQKDKRDLPVLISSGVELFDPSERLLHLRTL